MKTILALLLVVGATLPAAAQYYERPGPGYGPGYDRGYDRGPGYGPGPGPGYGPPPPRYQEPFGRRCNAVLETPNGPREMICPIVRPKPLGEPCACPPPPSPRGYPPGPFVGGQTIR